MMEQYFTPQAPQVRCDTASFQIFYVSTGLGTDSLRWGHLGFSRLSLVQYLKLERERGVDVLNNYHRKSASSRTLTCVSRISWTGKVFGFLGWSLLEVRRFSFLVGWCY